MPSSAARRTQGIAATTKPLVVYVASSLDGTSFTLDAASQQRVRAKFPKVHVTTRRVFISHDTRDAFDKSVGPFEDHIAVLLTGVAGNELVKAFGAISFRDPESEAEVWRLPPLKRAVRRA